LLEKEVLRAEARKASYDSFGNKPKLISNGVSCKQPLIIIIVGEKVALVFVRARHDNDPVTEQTRKLSFFCWKKEPLMVI
jgi:hypothetical protein